LGRFASKTIETDFASGRNAAVLSGPHVLRLGCCSASEPNDISNCSVALTPRQLLIIAQSISTEQNTGFLGIFTLPFIGNGLVSSGRQERSGYYPIDIERDRPH